jgi:hypothetical protein
MIPIQFAIYNSATGEITSTGSNIELILQRYESQGQHVFRGAARIGDYLENGVVIERPAKPEGFCVFDYTLKQWIDNRGLQELADAQWLLIKTARESAVASGFHWDGSKFDSDQISQERIQGAVSLAGLSPTFEITWTLFDNTHRVLNKEQMIAVGVALGAHVQTQFDKARALRDQIDAATTREAVFAVVW